MSSSGTISPRPTLPLPLPSSLPFPPFFAFSHIPLSRHKPTPTNDVTLRCKAVIDKRDILICDKATDNPSPSVQVVRSRTIAIADVASEIGIETEMRAGMRGTRQAAAGLLQTGDKIAKAAIRPSIGGDATILRGGRSGRSQRLSFFSYRHGVAARTKGRTDWPPPRRPTNLFFIVRLAVAAELQSDGLTRFAAFCSPSLDGRAV